MQPAPLRWLAWGSLVVVGLCSEARAASFRAVVEVLVDATRSGPGAPPAWELQKAALAKVLAATRTNRGRELYVRAMGGDPSLACDATPQLTNDGAAPAAEFSDALKRVRVTGQRPLATALEAASNDLAGIVASRTVIVLTSGPDTCGRDVCELASQLRQGAGLGSVHVIGVGGPPPKALACLGELHVAPDAAALEKQLLDLVRAAFTPTELRVDALDGTSRVSAEVEVFHAKETLAVERGRSGGTLVIGAGRYDVRVSVPDPNGEPRRDGWLRDVFVPVGEKTRLEVPLGKGPGTVEVKVRLNGVPAPPATRVSLHRPGVKDEELASAAEGEPMRVAPGVYDVRASVPGSVFGDLEVWRSSVDVPAGETTTVTLDARQKAGLLKAWAEAEGERVEEAVLMILPNGGRAGTDWSVPYDDPVTVPAGIYTLAARLDTPGGELKGFRDGVKVEHGADLALAVALDPSGFLEVAVDGETGAASDWMIQLNPLRRPPTGVWHDTGVSYRVPAGTYDVRLERSLGPIRRVRWIRGVVVAAREHKRIVVNVAKGG